MWPKTGSRAHVKSFGTPHALGCEAIARCRAQAWYSTHRPRVSRLARQRNTNLFFEECAMRYVVVTMSVAALMLGALAGSAEAKAKAGKTGATPATHTGMFVSATGGKLVMTGEKGKEQS